MCRDSPSGAAELRKCHFPNSYKVLHCRSREFAIQGLWGPCSHRVTTFLSTGQCQLRRMKAHPCLHGDGKPRSGFHHIWAGSCRAHSAEKARHTGRLSPGLCCVFTRGWEWHRVQNVLSNLGSTHHSFYRPHWQTHLCGRQRGAEESKRGHLYAPVPHERLFLPSAGSGHTNPSLQAPMNPVLWLF